MRIKPLGRVALLFCSFSIGLLSGCQKEQENIEQPLLKVKTVEVHDSQQASHWYLTGSLQAKTTIDLAFRVGGQIQQLNVDVGSQVTKGQQLVALDKADYKLAVASAEANINATDAEIEQTAADLKRISAMQQRNLASEQAKQQLQTQLQALQAKQKANQQQLKQAQNQLAYTQITAPQEGVISAKLAETSQVIAAGQPVLKLITAGNREVVVSVPEDRIESLPKQAQVQLDGKFYPVELRTTAPQANAVSRTWLAYYRLADNSEVDALSLGKTAKLQFKQASKGVQLPLSALYEQGDYSSVWLLQDSKAKRFKVKVERVDNDSAWVSADFPEDAKVIALGVHLLNEGQQLEEMP